MRRLRVAVKRPGDRIRAHRDNDSFTQADIMVLPRQMPKHRLEVF